MKILLVNPPDDLSMLGGGSVFVPKLEPLGLLYIAAVAKQAGYEVEVLDAFAEGLSREEAYKRILSARPDVAGFTSFTSNGGFLYTYGQLLKKELPNALVVFGNMHACVFAEQYIINGCCDIVVHGEGEYTFIELLKAHEAKSGWSVVPSISYGKDGRVVNTSVPCYVEDLTRLPLPARELVKQDLYDIGPLSNFRLKNAGKGKVSKHMFTSRGCPRRCIFCAVHHNIKQRVHSIAQIAAEMESLINEYNAGYIFFADSLFISDKRRVMNLCAEIRRRRLTVSWGCEAHVDFIDEELVKSMESAGCTDMNFGIESGVQRLLDRVCKGIKLENVEAALKIVKRHTGIKANGLFILGLPGETRKDSLETIAFAKRLPITMAQFSIFTPYPGSPLFNELKEKGEIDTGIRPDGTIDISVWPRYSAYISYTRGKTIWATPGQTSKSLKELQRKALRSFYLRPKPLITQLKRICWSDFPLCVKAFKDTFF
ncbi:MAG: B12-binding domain-containing radical SAM protein [Elusimicrobia bacterium GWC2_51_8]|nr:MAG: B12-binding domain-containing radical SAM protein [Elusimicrobia bacterium GWA2_51_34]OGR62893.1 MAG: B12-binding domain-containing radical SAM protein [Elusimicrobia bacterium GWC2_51_8]OGR87350.1 MAG: B12-binding domain-containing radical SAM protein [Elusimicrobia bacterium GWF2_52_66]HAF94936.1 radical SAM protein [Elusimicrobiota bacterium]HCE97490.1 radical SAM protein [Elusimicrobiota bacterium]